MMHVQNRRKLREMFQKYDVDHHGMLTADQLYMMLRDLS